jgi:hypothetical protein
MRLSWTGYILKTRIGNLCSSTRCPTAASPSLRFHNVTLVSRKGRTSGQPAYLNRAPPGMIHNITAHLTLPLVCTLHWSWSWFNFSFSLKFSLYSWGFVILLRPLWREGGSVIYCRIASRPCQSSHSWVEVPQNSRPYFSVSFETPPTWRARFPYLYPPETRWPSYTPGHWVTLHWLSRLMH